MTHLKHGPMPLGADPITMKMWEIRHQLDCNVQIIMRDHPDPEPRILPHEIETLTDHVYDRLAELETMIATLRGTLAFARNELLEAQDKFWVIHCNHPGTGADHALSTRQAEDKAFLGEMSERMGGAIKQIDSEVSA